MVVTNQGRDDQADLEINPLLKKAYEDGDNDLVHYFKLSPFEARDYKKLKMEEAIEETEKDFTDKYEEIYKYKEFLEKQDIEVSHTKRLINERYPKVEFDKTYYFDIDAVKFLISEVLKGENYTDAYDTLENKGTEQIKYGINSKLFQNAKKKGLGGKVSDRSEKAMLSVLKNLNGTMINLIQKHGMWKESDIQHYCTGSVNQVLNKLHTVLKRANKLKANAKEIKILTKENEGLRIDVAALNLSKTSKADEWHKVAEDMIDPIIHEITEIMKHNKINGTKKRTGINDISNKINKEQGISTKTVKSYCLSYINKKTGQS